MTVRLGARGVGCVLLDIEGTTTPMSFVHEILFGFAREHLDEYLRAECDSPEVRDAAHRLTVEHAEDVSRGESPPPRETGDASWAHAAAALGA